MRILLISALPELLEFFRSGHHYPAGVPAGVPADAAADGKMTFTRQSASEELPSDAPPPDGAGGGVVVAHITGTSERALVVARRLHERGVPFVYSPMIPSFPTVAGRAIGALAGKRSAAAADIDLARKIATLAGAVVACDHDDAKRFHRLLGAPGDRVHLVAEPRYAMTAGSEGVPAFANLAVAFCDEISPEWNVLRLLFALEKINADAIIVAGRTDTAYARACEARAALNPRARIAAFDRGGAGALAGEVGGLLRRASVVVDPSLRGLAGAAAANSSEAGVPAVISRSSARASRPEEIPAGAGGIFAFEPTSWELLNHALTCAFNRAAEQAKGAGAPRAAGATDHAGRNARIAEMLKRLYAGAAGPP